MKNSIGKRIRVFNKTNGKCFYCGCQLQFKDFHMEHLLPKVKNGKGGDNLVPSCKDCNVYKGTLTVDEFRDKIKNSMYSSIHGRMIKKYFDVGNKEIIFYFERGENGDL